MNEVSRQLVGYSFFFASLIVSIPSFFFEEFTNIINVYVLRKQKYVFEFYDQRGRSYLRLPASHPNR